MKRLLFTLLVLTLTAYAQTAVKSRLPKRLVADYTSGSKYLNPPYDVAQIPFHKLSHIIHAGVPWDSTGTLNVPGGFIEPNLIARAHAAGVKVMLLTGGDLAAAEADSTVLNAAVANLQTFVQTNNYDGIDVDWEFPETAQDAAFFVTLMTRLRAALPSPRYALSIDVAPWNKHFYNVSDMKSQIDFFNLMVYDCAGPWTSIGHLNSAIFWDAHDPIPEECAPGASDASAITMFLKEIPPQKINIGTPFYGYYYTNITGLFGLCPNAATTPDGFCDDAVQGMNYGPQIKQLINQQGWERHYDPVAFVPYLTRTDGSPGFITYDDAASTYLRVWYADWARGIGGTFMWSLDADYDGHSQDLLDAMYKATIGGKQ